MASGVSDRDREQPLLDGISGCVAALRLFASMPVNRGDTYLPLADRSNITPTKAYCGSSRSGCDP